MTEYIVKLTYIDGGAAGKAQRDADKVRKALGPLESLGGQKGRDVGRGLRNIADEWQRMAAQAERASARQAAAAERASARQSAAAARAGAKQERERSRLFQREAATKERAEKAMLSTELRRLRTTRREEAKEAKAADRAAKIRAAAEDKAARRSYYGGEKSFAGLLGRRANTKASGLATGAADSILGGPSYAIGAAADAIGSLVVGSARMAYNFGKATIAAQSMREESVEGFKAIYGMSADADRLFDEARDIAKQTKFETPEVVAQFNTLAAAGFSAEQLKKVYWSTADVGSARGSGKQAQYTRGLSKLNAQDAAMFGTFQQAAMAGPGLKNAEQELGKRLGINYTPKGGLDEHLRKMFRDHKIKGSTALESVMGATNTLYNKNTGKEGELAKAQGAKTWAGMISNIKAGLGDILNMKMDDSKGLSGFKTLLQAIGSDGGLFDRASARGERFAALVGRFVEDVFMPFGGVTLSNTGSLLDNIVSAGEALEKRFRAIMVEVSRGFGAFIKDARGSLLVLAEDIGVAIGTGLAKAAGKVTGSLWERTGGAAASNIWGLIAPESQKHYAETTETDAPLPSKAMPSFPVGGMVPGRRGSEQIIRAHAGEYVSGLNGEYASRMGGGGNTYNLTFIQNLAGSGDPVETAQRSAAENEMMLDRYFGRLMAQGA